MMNIVCAARARLQRSSCESPGLARYAREAAMHALVPHAHVHSRESRLRPRRGPRAPLTTSACVLNGRYANTTLREISEIRFSARPVVGRKASQFVENHL